MKFLLIVAAILIGLHSNNYGPPDPSLYSNPIIEYVKSGDLEQWEEIAHHTIENEEFMARIAWRFSTDFQLDECLYTNVLPYTTDVIWHFSQPFFEEDEIYIALVNQDYILTNILRGHPLPDGTVLFDFTNVCGGFYYFFEFSDLIV